MSNATPEQIRQDATESAKASIRTRAAIDEIVMAEGLEAEPEEIAQTLAVICRQNNMTMEQLKPYCDDEFQRAINRSVLTSKVMGLIRDAAIVAEG